MLPSAADRPGYWQTAALPPSRSWRARCWLALWQPACSPRVIGDGVYRDDRRLRVWLESWPQAYVLAVSGKEYVWLGGRQRQVKTILAALPEDEPLIMAWPTDTPRSCMSSSTWR
jgi:hypothetical protein